MKSLLTKISLFLFLAAIWLTPPTTTSLADQETSSGNTFAAGCWAAPTMPQLVTPTNNTITTASNLNFDWSDSSFVCPGQSVWYQFEWYSDPSLTNRIYQSTWFSGSQMTLTGVAEGTYYWRIRAKDGQGYTSNFTSTWKITVDRTAPTVSLSITGSYTKIVEEKITNGDFSTGDLNGWTTVGDVAVLANDTFTNPATTVYTPDASGSMVRIGRTTPTDTGLYTWENRLMQPFTSGAKSLSLSYNYFSRDYTPYDNPGFRISLNGQEVLKLNTTSVNPTNATDGQARSTGWKTFTYDLSGITTPDTNLAIYAGNTGDQAVQSWAYVDKITTYFVSAPSSATYTFSGTDSGSGIDYFRYKVDGNSWQTTSTSFSGGPIANNGSHTLQYYSIDKAGNSSSIYTVKTTTDTQAPSAVTSLTSSSSTANSITLTWTAPGNDGTTGRAATYDIRYQNVTSCSSFNWDSATKVAGMPTPATSGTAESLQVTGLNTSTSYCFAIKSADEAPNWSALSNLRLATTSSGSTVNPGDVVVNEIMWPGSSISPQDAWLELRNMTARTISLSGFTLTRYTTSEQTMPIDFSGKSIAPNGYFLIASSNSFPGGFDSQLNVTPNIWDGDLNLSDTNLQIRLYYSSTLIDTAWNRTPPKEGLFISGQKYFSMERTAIPGDGTNPLNWYTCIDEASTAEFFDSGALYERGTPGAANRSENEPVLSSPAPSEPKLTLFTNVPKTEVGFSLFDDRLPLFSLLNYTLTYDSNTQPQGLVGSLNLTGESQISVDHLTLGSCSTGSTCTYDANPHNFNLTVTLTGSDSVATVSASL